MPLPFHVNSSLPYLKISTTSCNIMWFLGHTTPSTNNLETSAITASDTIILTPFIVDCPFYKCCKNSRDISLLGTWSLVKYDIHPICTKISLALLEISNTKGSRWTYFPPIMLEFFQHSPYNFQRLTQLKNAIENNNFFGKIE